MGQGLLIHWFLDHTQRHTTVGRTPLDEWSARSRDLYLHNAQDSRQTSMSPVGFEHTISAGERPLTYVLDHAATGTGCTKHWVSKFNWEAYFVSGYCTCALCCHLLRTIQAFRLNMCMRFPPFPHPAHASPISWHRNLTDSNSIYSSIKFKHPYHSNRHNISASPKC